MRKTLVTILMSLIFSLIGVQAFAEWIDVETYAYTAEFEALTASGVPPYEGGIACNFLPLGTQVMIDGNWYVVNDRTGGNGNFIDIYMSSYDACIAYGTQTKRVWVER